MTSRLGIGRRREENHTRRHEKHYEGHPERDELGRALFVLQLALQNIPGWKANAQAVLSRRTNSRFPLPK